MATLLHSPNLDTVLMVERAIERSRDYPTKMQLWRGLPRKVQYQTFKAILEYLEASSKIMFDEHSHIIWVAADNPKLRRLLARSVEMR